MINANSVIDEIRKFKDRNEYQRPIFGTKWYNIPCRWNEEIEVIMDNENRQVQSSVQVVFGPEIDKLPPLSELDHDGYTYIVIKSQVISGFVEPKGVRVYLTGGKKIV